MKRSLLVEVTFYVVLVAITAAICIGIDAFDLLYDLTRVHESWELDELLAVLPGTFLCVTIYAVRRSLALRKEVKARREAETKAMDSLRIKRDFMALVSHEMRTPVTGIIGALNIAKNSRDPEERNEFVQLADNSAKSLARLVEDVITFARIDYVKPQMKATAINPESLVNAAVDAIQAEAINKGIEVRVEMDESIPLVLLGFDGPMRQIFFNLTGNALKFTHKGSITLSLSFTQEKHNAGLLHLTVADTGEGIREHDLGKIFEPYYQASQDEAKRNPGLGLGLSLVSRLLAMLGGDIEVESKLGQGSRFHVSIPVQLASTTPPTL